jgi:tetratricopeptide (TPR) repeat protein
MLHTGVAVYGNRPGFSVTDKERYDLFVREGLNATISVTADKLGAISLATNGKFDASTGSDMRTQLALGYFPVLLHPAPRDVLVIGFGSGVTIRAVVDFAEVSSVDCVEIEPAVFAVADYFRSVNRDVLEDPRVRCSVDDARGYLAARDARYDVIISEPSNPWIQGVAALFSREFYELSRSRLNPGGIFCQWVELYGLRPEDLKTVFATFREVFPQATVWQPSEVDILLVGATGDAPPALDLADFASRIKGGAGYNLQAYFGIREPVDFLSFYITGPEGVASLSPAGTPINTDDRSHLEFKAPLALHENSAWDNFLFLTRALAYPPDLGAAMPGPHGEAEFLYRKSRNIVRMGVEIPADWVEAALERDPANDDYRAEIASLKFRDGESPAALAILSDILGRSPDHARAHFLMGLVLKVSDPEHARAHFERAAAADPGSLDMALEAGQASLAAGEFARAREHFMRALGIPHKTVDHARRLFFAGYTAMRSGAENEGLALFAQALDANPYDYQFLLDLSDIYGPLGLTRQTCMLAERALTVPIESVRKEIQKRLPSAALCAQLRRP